MIKTTKYKESACSAGDPDLIPGLGRPPGDGKGYPLQYSCLQNSLDTGAWRAIVHCSQRVGHNWAINFHFSYNGYIVDADRVQKVLKSIHFEEMSQFSGQLWLYSVNPRCLLFVLLTYIPCTIIDFSGFLLNNVIWCVRIWIYQKETFPHLHFSFAYKHSIQGICK